MMLLLEMAPVGLHACFRVVNPPNFGREKFVLRPMIPVRSSGRLVISHPPDPRKGHLQAAIPHPYHKNHLTTGFNPSPTGRPHLDVAVFHARIRELGSQKRGPPGVLVAGSAVHPRHCGAPAGGIVRIQPQHVGLRIVPEGHHQHHATVQSFSHGFQATLQVEVIHIPEGFLHIGAWQESPWKRRMVCVYRVLFCGEAMGNFQPLPMFYALPKSIQGDLPFSLWLAKKNTSNSFTRTQTLSVIESPRTSAMDTLELGITLPSWT